MKKTAFVIALFGLVLFGCKHQYWTIIDSDEGETVAVVDQPEPKPEVVQPEPESEPEVTPPTPKQIIFILGVDGMD